MLQFDNINCHFMSQALLYRWDHNRSANLICPVKQAQYRFNSVFVDKPTDKKGKHAIIPYNPEQYKKNAIYKLWKHFMKSLLSWYKR